MIYKYISVILNTSNFFYGKNGRGHLRELPGTNKMSPGQILTRRI